ncbi:hypothetical protein O181_011097 [Austropuccinia psidii MF-1]|uniref:Uncharacterized protein n=1 Tax=Austropuccinia psidii MF-1 TaxID=1389203 RepID=A0A9Q3BTW1_9BASI|nr:hypothetical protein [Austropuccinia psidii MF-1]
MEDITKRNKIGRRLYKAPTENNTGGKTISRERPDRPQDRDPLKFHKCGSTSHLADNCPKKTRIIDIELEKTQDTKESNEFSLQGFYFETSEEEELQD